jgi:murein L,D-transpeptidase YcbB/YkuD
LFSIYYFFLFENCKGKEASNANSKRDTTITAKNAFSELLLDSAKLEKFITDQELKDSAAERMRNFYNSRNYHFAWFTQDGLAEQARGFWNLHNNYINYTNDSSLIDKKLHEQMEIFINKDTLINLTHHDITETELQLTKHFFKYARYAYAGKINPKDLQWHIPRKKLNVVVLLDSLVANKGRNIAEWEPVNQLYRLLSNELVRFYEIEKAGGWKNINPNLNRKYKKGDSALVIKEVKQRLQIAGDYEERDTSYHYIKIFMPAVKQAQKRFGLKQNGIIDASLLKELNVPVADRIEQLLINMERMRWMPKQPAGDRIVANIPEFKLHVYQGAKEIFVIDIVVGKAANKTVIFNDNLKYVVFSPYWNVPASIVRNEILPAMQGDGNYLDRMNMEQTGTSNGLPVIRQKPGGSNALGKVKFIFPNRYNIYFHDTPAKPLFSREKRAFSHGCIRVANPKKLAEYLLRNQPEWTSVKIAEAMNASEEKWVTLKEQIPIFITYFTAWVDHDGLLNFRDDIYGRDKKLAERLFENPIQKEELRNTTLSKQKL